MHGQQQSVGVLPTVDNLARLRTDQCLTIALEAARSLLPVMRQAAIDPSKRRQQERTEVCMQRTRSSCLGVRCSWDKSSHSPLS
jgi:hypothetical protein